MKKKASKQGDGRRKSDKSQVKGDVNLERKHIDLIIEADVNFQLPQMLMR